MQHSLIALQKLESELAEHFTNVELSEKTGLTYYKLKRIFSGRLMDSKLIEKLVKLRDDAKVKFENATEKI